MTLDVPGDWWPTPLQWIAEEDPGEADPILLAEVSEPSGMSRYRHLFSALADGEVVDDLLGTSGFQGHDVDSNGPHPSAGVGEYEPDFWVFTNGVLLEPLVLSWDAGSGRVLVPQPGLLMTYGLVPRLTGVDQVVHWDDPSEPEADQVVAKSVTPMMFGSPSDAWVKARRNVLRDYVSLRGLTLVHVYYAEATTPADAEAEALLAGVDDVETELPGRTVRVVRLMDGRVKYMCWGIRRVLDPNGFPITEGRWDYPELTWPGIAAPVTKERASGAGLHGIPSKVYVRDTVLADFEGRPEYTINPELGSVSHGIQWGVSWCHRFGRDLIQVDLKKLYEGNRPSIVSHYHAHAISPPDLAMANDPNVATRSRRICYGLADIGVPIATLLNQLSDQDIEPKDVVGLDRGEMDYRGWWEFEHVEPITRHIPPGLNRDEFLARCGRLDVLVAEGLSEGHLRRLLVSLGTNADDIKNYRSIRLLDRLTSRSRLALESGLSLVDDFDELEKRAAESPTDDTPGSRLQAVNWLRQLSGHAIDEKDAKLVEAMKSLGLDPDAFTEGYDAALDVVYDLVADALEETRDLLQLAMFA